MLERYNLEGRVAFVSGASRGLGRAMAIGLAEVGCSLFVTAAKGTETLKELAAEVQERFAVRCEWTDMQLLSEESIQAAVKKCVDCYGRIDVLLNNAGAPRINKALQDTSLEEWNQVIDINLNGAFVLCREVGKQMIRQKSGSIISLASISGQIINKGAHGGSYDVSKAGIVALTKAMAAEWSQYNIRANAIAPGYFLTEPNIKAFESRPGAYEAAIDRIPMGRMANPDELQGAIVFLASEASSYMQGTVLGIDGGYLIW